MPTRVRILQPGDASILDNVAADVFDEPLNSRATKEFLNDPRHHIAVALDEGQVVGFASGVHYLHPDKPIPELFVNEVGVAPGHRNQGLGKRILEALLKHGAELGCQVAWVLTDHDNVPARRLYSSCASEQDASEHLMFSFRLR